MRSAKVNVPRSRRGVVFNQFCGRGRFTRKANLKLSVYGLVVRGLRKELSLQSRTNAKDHFSVFFSYGGRPVWGFVHQFPPKCGPSDNSASKRTPVTSDLSPPIHFKYTASTRPSLRRTPTVLTHRASSGGCRAFHRPQIMRGSHVTSKARIPCSSTN